MNNQLKHPVLYIFGNTSDMHCVMSKKNYGALTMLNDKKHIKKYHTNVIIIDSKGSIYKKLGTTIVGKPNWYLSLINVCKMVRHEPILDKELSHITLEDLKIKVMNKVKENKRKWLPLGSVEVIQDFVDEAKTYKELILFFR